MMLDIDNDGYFSREDISRVVSEHGLFEVRPPVSRGCGLCSDATAKRTFAGQDPSKAATEAVMAREQADRAFAAIDSDGDGVITQQEFRSALTEPEPEPEGERARARGSE